MSNPTTHDHGKIVRAPASIPFMFEPVTLKSTFGSSVLVDGSVLRSYPIEVFDRGDGKPLSPPHHRSGPPNRIDVGERA